MSEAETVTHPPRPDQGQQGVMAHQALAEGPTVPFRVAGDAVTGIAPEHLSGAWILRFGLFGCRDQETRGGVAHVEPGRLFGGDHVFAYDGTWTLDGTELCAALQIVRHGADPYWTTVFGTDEDNYRAEFVAEVITPYLIEGRVKRADFSDARLTMRRLAVRER